MYPLPPYNAQLPHSLGEHSDNHYRVGAKNEYVDLEMQPSRLGILR